MTSAKKAQTVHELQISGELDTKELASGFLAPLDRLVNSNVEKIVIDFDKDNNTIKMSSTNSEKTVMIFVDYLDPIVDAFKIEETTELGIMDIKQFKSMVGIFSDGFDIKISGDVTIENDNQQFIFRPANPDSIPDSFKKFAGNVKWESEFVWNQEEFSGFNKALSTLSQEYVIFSGEEGEKTLSVKFCDKHIKSSSYDIKIDLEDENQSSFNIILPKENLEPVVKCKQNLSVQISDRVISFYAKSEYNTVRHYLSVVSDNG